MASSSRVRIAYRTAGGTGPWTIFRRTGDALTVGTETQRSDEVRDDRTRGDMKTTTITAGGSVDIEFSSVNFDAFIAAAIGGAWSADSVSNGTTIPRFDLLKSYQDTGDHVLFENCCVWEMSLSANAGEKVTGQITFQGSGHNDNYDPSGDTFDQPEDTIIMDASNNLGSITVDGAPLSGMCFTAISLNISGGFQTDQCVGSLYQNHFEGSVDITGSVTTRLSAAALDLWRNSITSTPVALGFELSDPDGYAYTLALPRNFLSGDLPSGGLDTILTSELSLTAARNDLGVMLQIDRTVPAP